MEGRARLCARRSYLDNQVWSAMPPLELDLLYIVGRVLHGFVSPSNAEAI